MHWQRISSNLTAKILKEAINQQKEIEEEDKKKDLFYSLAENTNLAPEGEGSDEDAFEGYSDSHSQYDGDIVSLCGSLLLPSFLHYDNGYMLLFCVQYYFLGIYYTHQIYG